MLEVNIYKTFIPGIERSSLALKWWPVMLLSVFKAKRAEMNWALKQSGPRDVMTEMEAIVRLRGLPYGCSKEEIANFFSGN